MPMLIRRFLEARERFDVEIMKPVRVKRDRIIAPRFPDLDRALALMKHQSADAVLVMVDADEACAARLGPALTRSSRKQFTRTG